MFVGWSGRSSACPPETPWGNFPPGPLPHGPFVGGLAVRAEAGTTTYGTNRLSVVCVAPSWGPYARMVADAYERLERRLHAGLPGDFCMALVDRVRGILFATSGLTSFGRIAFARIRGAVLVSSRVLALATHRDVDLQLDEGYLAHQLTGLTCPPAGASPLRGVRRLGLGEALVVEGEDARVVTLARFIPQRERYTSFKACARAFWDTLVDASSRRSAAGRSCLALSGGLDSSAVGVALAKDQSAPLPSFSIIASGLPDERECIEAVGARLGVLPTLVE